MVKLTEKQQKLIDMVLRHEGGYVNNALDKGKETYCGISRAYHPNWEGWKLVDKHKPLKTNQKINDESLQLQVYNFYLEKFYSPIKIDKIDNIIIAGHLFCHAVNAGLTNAVKILQKAINNVYQSYIVVDGKIGAITLSWTNNASKQEELITEIIKLRKTYYENIVRNKPSQNVFLKGWLNRVNSTTAYCSSLQPIQPQQLGFVSSPNKTKENATDNDISLSTILRLLYQLILSFFKK